MVSKVGIVEMPNFISFWDSKCISASLILKLFCFWDLIDPFYRDLKCDGFNKYYPGYVFSFNLLDWAESLLLECQVTLKDFCQALYFRCPYSIVKVMTTIQYILIFVTVYCSVFFMCSNILFHRDEIFIAVSLIHLRNIGI